MKGVPAESVEVAHNWYWVRTSSSRPALSFVIENESLQTTNGVEGVEWSADGHFIIRSKTRSSMEQVR